MRRGKFDIKPPPVFWIDWRCVVLDHSYALKLAFRVLQNTLLFDYAASKLPVDKRVLHWFARNYRYTFMVFVVGKETSCIDSVLYSRLKDEWVQNVVYFDSFDEVLEEFKMQPWVLGILTRDGNWLDSTKSVYHFDGPGMQLKSLPVFSSDIGAEFG